MNILGKRIETQVQFWSLLGPFVILLAIAILLFKVSSHWYFPVSVLVGVPLCLKWKLKGLAAALILLFTLFAFSYPNLNLDERYWYVGMGMAMAFSLVILTLSLEEATGIVEKLQAESRSRLENYLRLDESVKDYEAKWNAEKDTLIAKTGALTTELTKVQEERQTLEKLVYLAKDELIALRSQHEQLLQDLFYKKQQVAQLHERIEENEATIQGFVNADTEQHIQKLTEQLANYEEKDLQLSQLLKVREEEIKMAKQQRFHLEQLIEQRDESLIQQQEHFNLQLKDAIYSLDQNIQTLQQEKEHVLRQLKHSQEQLEIAKGQSAELVQALATVTELKQALGKTHYQIQEKELHIASLKEQLHQAQATKIDFSSEISSLKGKLDGAYGQLSDKQRQVSHLENRLIGLNQELAQNALRHHEESQALKEQLNSIRNLKVLAESKVEELSCILNDADHLRKALGESESQLEERKRHVQTLECCLKELGAEWNERVSVLEQENSQLELQLKDAQVKKEEIREQLDGKQQTIHRLEINLAKLEQELLQTKPETKTQDIRRTQGMYLQLRQQFEEKSAVLDAARRELFFAEERLLSREREEEENALQLSETEALLQKELLSLIKELEELNEQHQLEIEASSKLVEDFLFNASRL